MKRRRRAVVTLALAARLAGHAVAAPRTVIFPRAEHGGDRRDDYPVQLLLLAMGRAAPGRRVDPAHGHRTGEPAAAARDAAGRAPALVPALT